MTGTFERLRYDEDSYNSYLAEDEKRINYLVSVPPNCRQCRPPQPGILAGQGVSIDPKRSLVEIESELQHLGRPLSKCPANDYQPKCPRMFHNNEGYPCGSGVVRGPEANQPRLRHLPECPDLGAIESRTIAAPCTLRGTGFDRWQNLCLDPQCRKTWEFPGEHDISFRSVIRDSFRPCLPKPLDQTAVLPKGHGALPCIKLSGSACAPFTQTLAADRYNHPYPAGYPRRQTAQ